MIRSQLDFKETHFFSPAICDYIERSDMLSDLYGHFPDEEGLLKQIEIKKVLFSTKKRHVLSNVLEKQYKDCPTSISVQNNIIALKSPKTFSITTGHQLNLFTGPLYFLYKIITTIQVSRKLQKKYPKYTFVPIYWMATEDHDFEEINHFIFKSKSYLWHKNTNNSSVGECSTEGLEKIFELFSQELGSSEEAIFLKDLFTKSYLSHPDLTSATRYLVNTLFKAYGLVIIDANERNLKSSFVEHIKTDLFSHLCYKTVKQTCAIFEKRNYIPQVNPREINFFYLFEGKRRRIIQKDKDNFTLTDSTVAWSHNTLLQEVEHHPERFSPNVLMRPLYQESILPNICYVGGGGELTYWLQLKSFFKNSKVPFPVLMLRHSALIVTEKWDKKIQKLGLQYEDLFLSKDQFIRRRIEQISEFPIDLSKEKKTLKDLFKNLHHLAQKTDASFLGAVKAQEQKQINGLEYLEKRLLKAQKRMLSSQILRCVEIKDVLFPNGYLQERTLNFAEFYLEYGDEFIPKLMAYMQPYHYKFLVI